MAILRRNREIDLDSTEEYYSSDPTGVPYFTGMRTITGKGIKNVNMQF